MNGSPHGYIPKKGYLQSQLDTILSSLDDLDIPNFYIHEYDPLLDSSNIDAEHWNKIALDISEHYDDYDGFVVLHGTDTMAYTASALPFLLQGLTKPVVVTGSQIPLYKIRNDGYGNLITSMMVAAYHKIPEVMLLFGSRILRGCRSVKVDAYSLNAFESPNFPALGHIGVNIEINNGLIQKSAHIPFHVNQFQKTHVGILRIFPGMTTAYVRNVLDVPLQGLLLETYGQGNAPNSNQELLDVLKKASDRGVLIVNCSQCIRGSVDQKIYAVGRTLMDSGVIGGLDMTASAALVKMYYLLSQDLSLEEMQQQIQQPLCGELTSKNID